MKLELIKDNDTWFCMIANTRNEYWLEEQKGNRMVAGVTRDTLTVNLDQVKKLYYFLTFPQILFHEFLHWLSRGNFYAGKRVHLIRRKTRGLVV